MTAYRPLSLPADSPRVQSRNKELWNEARSPEGADFYTIGYAGRRIDEFVRIVESAGVASLVDIRFAAVSQYSPAFSGKNLEERLERSGIHYLHRRELGVPRDIRARAIASGSREAIWEWYDEYVVARLLKNMDNLLNAAEHPFALLCVETDPMACHRHRLFLALEDRGLRGFDL